MAAAELATELDRRLWLDDFDVDVAADMAGGVGRLGGRRGRQYGHEHLR